MTIAERYSRGHRLLPHMAPTLRSIASITTANEIDDTPCFAASELPWRDGLRILALIEQQKPERRYDDGHHQPPHRHAALCPTSLIAPP